MGLVSICKYKRTKNPFFVEQAGLNLYSLEELSWFLYHNICLADRRMLGERLCRWLSEEVECPKLAHRIQKEFSAGADFKELVLSVVEESDMFDSRQLSELSDRMKGLANLQEQERLKIRADELLNNRNEWAAMEEYQHILRMHQNGRLGMAFYAAVWNNLGVCCVRQFLFQEAEECFDTSCEYEPNEEVKQQAELARALALGQRPENVSGDMNYVNPQKKLLQWELEYRTRQKQ